mgnify:CR=1 FL=1
MRKLITFLLSILLIVSCANNSERETFINDLLSKMTLDEKIGQMNQYNGFWDATGPMPEGEYQKARYRDLKNGLVGSMLNVTGVDKVRALQKIAVDETRLGIPLIFAFDVIHGYQTISPIPLAESSSWDLEVIEKSARIAAIEASAAGLNWTFAPMVDISRDARWGRVMEGAGEDPFLGSLIAKARVKGFQGDNLSDYNTIAACAKHFASYGFAEAGRDYNTADTNEYTLFNTILGPQLGVNISNFGPKMEMSGSDLLVNADVSNIEGNNPNINAELSTDSFDLPLVLRVGISDKLEYGGLVFLWSIDAVNPIDNSEYLNTGFEVNFWDRVYLRTGSKSIFMNDREELYTVGLGTKLKLFSGQNFKLDYSYQILKYLPSTIQFSIGLSY